MLNRDNMPAPYHQLLTCPGNGNILHLTLGVSALPSDFALSLFDPSSIDAMINTTALQEKVLSVSDQLSLNLTGLLVDYDLSGAFTLP